MRLLQRIHVGKRGDSQEQSDVKPSAEIEPPHHVTTERLKRQFEERLADRSRRRRAPK